MTLLRPTWGSIIVLSLAARAMADPIVPCSQTVMANLLHNPHVVAPQEECEQTNTQWCRFSNGEILSYKCRERQANQVVNCICSPYGIESPAVDPDAPAKE